MPSLSALWLKLFPKKYYSANEVPAALRVLVYKVVVSEEFESAAMFNVFDDTWDKVKFNSLRVPVTCNENTPFVVVLVSSIESNFRKVLYFTKPEFDAKFGSITIMTMEECHLWLETLGEILDLKLEIANLMIKEIEAAQAVLKL